MRKQKVKLSLLANDMVLYVGNLKESTNELLELISKFSKVEVYKINKWKTIVFLYMSDEQSKIKLKKQFYLQWHHKE